MLYLPFLLLDKQRRPKYNQLWLFRAQMDLRAQLLPPLCDSLPR